MVNVFSISKASFYLGLIIYYSLDFYYDWRGYYALKNNEAFAVIPKHNSVARISYLASCISGAVFGGAMLLVYFCYIQFHMCTDGGGTGAVRSLAVVESFLSVCELLFKDDIQSILLFLIYHSDPHTKCVSFLTKAFTVCSIVAHLKLFLCFSSNLLLCESGKICVIQFFGCTGSLIFLVFTSLKFSEMQNWLPYNGPTSSNCTRSLTGLPTQTIKSSLF